MEKRLEPKLSFPEFSGEWKKVKAREILTFRQGYQIPFNKQINYPKEGYLRYLYISDFFSDSKTLYVKKEEKMNVLEAGDIVVANTGNTAGSFYKSKKGILSNNMFSIAGCSELNNNFLFQFMSSKYYEKQLLKFFNSGGQPHLGHKNMGMIKIGFPPLPEQEKIASFLSSIDSKIDKLEKKRKLLSQYKKGVMQKIFSQEIRFKDESENDYPQWEEKKLGEIAKYYDGTHQTPKYVEKGIPFYSVEHVTANQFEKTKFISEEVFEKENKRVRLEKNDLLMTRIGSIGEVRLIDWDVNASFYVSLALIKSNGCFNSKYLNFLIQSDFFQRELWKRTIHVAFPKKINLGEIGNCHILLPCLEEQEKIAAFLSSIDKKIEVVEREVEKNKEFKKGLLQQMFV